MRRLSQALLVGVLTLAAAAACGGSPGGGGGGTPTLGASAAGSPSATPSTTTPADPWVLSADGIGPYRIGAHVLDLEAAGLLGLSSPINATGCIELSGAAATGV